MKKQKCFLVCNAHIDPVWLWPWEEGLTEAISTFRIAADFCDKHPDFVFVHNEALLYEWVERNDPPLFARIQKLVKQGKWCISGGAYLQPDLIGPGGEAVVRQYLLGLRYFLEKFGVRPETAYNFDTFGHPQGLAQILAGCGFQYYVFCRPNPNQKPLPVGPFLWRHASGAQIVARRSDDHYLTQGELRKSMRDGNWPKHYAAEGDFMFLWGIGNHGGGPSRKEYAQLPEMRRDFPDVEFIESSPDAFFAHTFAMRDKTSLPVVTGDFNQVMDGCYTSMIRIKQRHWELENMANTVERLCALAWSKGKKEYPAIDLNSAWKDILFAEFHDILPGSGIETVERESLNALAHAEEILRRKRAETMIALLRDEPQGADMATPFFVFNPHAHEITTLVEMEYGNALQWGSDGVIRHLFSNGKELPAQFERPEMNLDDPNWGEWRRKAVFMLTLPALGYRRIDATYECIPKENIRPLPMPVMPDAAKVVVHAPGFEFEVSRRTGLASCKLNGETVLKPGSFLPEIFDDIPNSWEVKLHWKKSAGQFRLMTVDEATRYLTTEAVNPGFKRRCRPVQVVEDGPFRTVIEAHFLYHRSALTVRYLVEKTRARVRVELESQFMETEKMLKLALRPAAPAIRLEAEKCYSIDDETNAVSPRDRERTFQRFIRSTPAQGSAWAVLGHGTHAYHVTPSALHLSVLRTPAYSAMRVTEGNEHYRNRLIAHQDIGVRKAAFTFCFGAEAASNEALVAASLEVSQPPVGFVYFPTQENMKPKAPAAELEISAKNVVLGALKRSEDGASLVIRLWECAGRDTKTELRCAGKKFPVSIKANALATFRLTNGKLEETDLLENKR